jgi:hypothetical protein
VSHPSRCIEVLLTTETGPQKESGVCVTVTKIIAISGMDIYCRCKEHRTHSQLKSARGYTNAVSDGMNASVEYVSRDKTRMVLIAYCISAPFHEFLEYEVVKYFSWSFCDFMMSFLGRHLFLV